MTFLAIGALVFLAFAYAVGVATLFICFPAGVFVLAVLSLFTWIAWRGAQKDIRDADAGLIPTGRRAPGPFWR